MDRFNQNINKQMANYREDKLSTFSIMVVNTQNSMRKTEKHSEEDKNFIQMEIYTSINILRIIKKKENKKYIFMMAN